MNCFLKFFYNCCYVEKEEEPNLEAYINWDDNI